MNIKDLDYRMGGSAMPGVNELTFDCPLCGPPYRIRILARLNGPASEGVWAWSTDPSDYEKITVTPSIDNHNHGRKKACGWHGNITAGEVSVA